MEVFQYHPSVGCVGADQWWAQVAGQRIQMGGGTSWLIHSDNVGTTTMVTDQTGTVDNDAIYYPWGQIWKYYGGSNAYVFGDLDYQINYPLPPSATRFYNPPLGRWISPDPSGRNAVSLTNPQTWNMYAYVTNNPASFNDPLGLSEYTGSGGVCDPYLGDFCPPACSDFDPECMSGCGTVGAICDPIPPPLPMGGAAGVDFLTAPPNGQPPLAGGGGNGFISPGGAAVWDEIEQDYPLIAETVWACAFLPVCQEALGAGVAGAAVGVAVGYGVAKLQNYIHQSKGGRKNIRPSWAEKYGNPLPGESSSQYADRLCRAEFGPEGCPGGKGPGSTWSLLRKWARDKFGI